MLFLVIAIDLDKIKLKCARRNAEIYGVRDQIYFLHMDFFDFVKWYCPRFRKMRQILCSNPVKRKTALSSVKDQWSNIGAVFLSPPWGGPSYSKRVVSYYNVHAWLFQIHLLHLLFLSYKFRYDIFAFFF